MDATQREEKRMLGLAALTYRGFASHSEATIQRKVNEWLPELRNEGLGTWKLVWGPATLRFPTALVDDSMVYVAQEQHSDGKPGRYVVAIRGTNPISPFDWFFGDFWVNHRVAWNGDPLALLSGSTQLGLLIIKNLAAEDPASQGSELDELGNAIADSLGDFAAKLPEPVDLSEASAWTDDELRERIDAFAQLIDHGEDNPVLGRIRNRLDSFLARSLQPLKGALHDHVLRQIAECISKLRKRDRGTDLATFFRKVPPQSRVAVVGHSKGGALANATALWLAETQGATLGTEIECFTFAGPTPGNAGFATRYALQPNLKTRRIVNKSDLVPHAWTATDLTGFRRRNLYPLLGPAIDRIAGEVAKLEYAHVGTLNAFDGDEGSGTTVQRIIHHHLDAYLRRYEFGPQWNATTLFLN
jgi:hypothetical protein